MIDLISRGHQVGGGLLSPDNKTFFFCIPKNASTFMTGVLLQNNWEYANISYFTGTEVICLVRDPLDRWISGISTYCCLHLLNQNYGSDMFVENYNTLVERLIFDNIVFDDHTTPQIEFINTIPVDKNIVYFLAEKKSLIKKLSDYLGYTLNYNLHEINENSTENNYDQKRISDLLSLKLNSYYKDKIARRYHRDYQLLEYAR